MARKIGESTYEVAPGIVVQPIQGADEIRDGWQIIDSGEYVNDYRTKWQAIEAAERLIAIKTKIDAANAEFSAAGEAWMSAHVKADAANAEFKVADNRLRDACNDLTKLANTTN